MQKLKTITIKEYLTRKGIAFRENGKEIITYCLFNNCDEDSGDQAGHLYFNSETGQYDCKKCGEQGNMITLAKHLGDSINDITLNPRKFTQNIRKYPQFDSSLVETCHQAIPDRIRRYLNARGISDAVIDDHKLGWGEFYGKWWITIPIQDIDGNFIFLKLRKDPEDKSNDIKYKFYPAGSNATIYGWKMLENNNIIVICEGEFDQLILLQNAIPAITSTAGAGTFKNEWIEPLKKMEKIYICFDKDEAGEKGAGRLIKLLSEHLPDTAIYKIKLPE